MSTGSCVPPSPVGFLRNALLWKRQCNKIAINEEGFSILKCIIMDCKVTHKCLHNAAAHERASGFTGVSRWDSLGSRQEQIYIGLVWDIEGCVLVKKRMETGVINYRCGSVVWGNAVTVTRGIASEKRGEGRCEGWGGRNPPPSIPSITSIYITWQENGG